MIVSGLPGIDAGPGYTQAAVEFMLPGFGSTFVALALFFFAFTTMVAYYYIAETNIAYINRKVHRPWLYFVLKIGLLGAVTYGSVRTAGAAWDLGDVGVGIMAWLNIIAILIIQKPALIAPQGLRGAEEDGKDPVFDPESLASRTPNSGSSATEPGAPAGAHAK